MDKKTSAIHTGVDKDSAYNSVTTPIYTTSNFAFETLDKTKGFDYTRSGNPTRTALEQNLNALEGGDGCCATSTGMSAITTILFLCKPGDHIITGDDIYGGSYRLFKDIFSGMGINFSFINMRDINLIKQTITPQTKMIWIETPSNPLLNIIDIETITNIAKENDIISVVDNTFLSPYFQSPFELGADIIIHSTTKYLNGHSDVVGGAIIFKQKYAEQIRFLVNCLGVSEAPFDAWLVLRGVKTLAYRMEAHQANAQKLAEFLEQHENVKKVYYPGLASHPQQDLIKKQMKGFGGMLSFELDTSKVKIESFFKKLKYFALAESLGGIESLIEQPWSMSHASMGAEGLKSSGITPETIRVSVGLEDAQDLIEDLDQALQ